jgi:hypothetical protein
MPGGGQRARNPSVQPRVDPLYPCGPKQRGQLGADYPDRNPGRYSDPGGLWAQSYRGIQGVPARRINEQYGERTHLRNSAEVLRGWSDLS